MIEIYEACDVHEAIDRFASRGERAQCTMLDPWYNKGVGGERDDYFEYITDILNRVAPFSDHIYLWGFPEIIVRIPGHSIAGSDNIRSPIPGYPNTPTCRC